MGSFCYYSGHGEVHSSGRDWTFSVFLNWSPEDGKNFPKVQPLLCLVMWGFPKIRSSFLGVPVLRIVVHLG